MTAHSAAHLLDALQKEAHVWLAQETVPDAARASWEAMLDPTERGRYQRFHFDADRDRFLAAHALVRRTLSQYVDQPPEAWVFEQASSGRPKIVPAPGMPPLNFSLSHTRGLVACLVVLEIDGGIDVEHVRPSEDLPTLARKHFHEIEVQGLQELPDPARAGRFFDLWTLKEAYLKARAVGLALPLSTVFFVDEPPKGLALRFSPEAGDSVDAWQIHLDRPTPEHRLAVALRTGAGQRLRIVTFPMQK